MNPIPLPWLEIAVATPLALALPVSLIRDRLLALRVCTITCAAAFGATFAAWFTHYVGLNGGDGPIFRIDELTAPLLPVIALLHFLMAMTTSTWKAESFGAVRYLISLSLRLAVFATLDPSSV